METLYSEVDTYWQDKKRNIIKNINLAIKRNKVDKDILEIMREMVDKARIRINYREKEE